MFPQMLQFENVLKIGQKYFGSVTNSSRVYVVIMYQLTTYIPKCTSLIRGPLYVIFYCCNMKKARLEKIYIIIY